MINVFFEEEGGLYFYIDFILLLLKFYYNFLKIMSHSCTPFDHF